MLCLAILESGWQIGVLDSRPYLAQASDPGAQKGPQDVLSARGQMFSGSSSPRFMTEIFSHSKKKFDLFLWLIHGSPKADVVAHVADEEAPMRAEAPLSVRNGENPQ